MSGMPFNPPGSVSQSASSGPFVPESATGEPFFPAGVPDGAPFPAAAGCVDGFRAAGGAAPDAAGLEESPPCARRGNEV